MSQQQNPEQGIPHAASQRDKQAAPLHVIQNPKLFPVTKLYFPDQNPIQSTEVNPLQPCPVSHVEPALGDYLDR